MLAVAISCIAQVWCGSSLHHRIRVIGHVCSNGSFRTRVMHLKMVLVITILRHDARLYDTDDVNRIIESSIQHQIDTSNILHIHIRATNNL